jgi:putative exporter of polyketide antibiotics
MLTASYANGLVAVVNQRRPAGNPASLCATVPAPSRWCEPGAVTCWPRRALMSVILVIRHTRGDEEAGRLELVGATAVGRQAAPVAGVALALSASTVLGLLIMVVSVLLGLPAVGSLALGLEVAAAGWVAVAHGPGHPARRDRPDRPAPARHGLGRG